jgi:hypothetical protein
MKTTKTNSVIYFLLWIFLFPLAVKTIHSHEPSSYCTTKSEKHFHVHEKPCYVCTFHFSHFTQQHTLYKLFIKEVFGEPVFLYPSVFIKKLYFCSLLLRGPPVNHGLESNNLF